MFLEDAEEAGAAAGEGRIEGALCVKGFVYFFEFGVQVEYGCFEIVDKGTCPGIDGSADDSWKGIGGFVGGAKGKGLCGADVDAGVDEDESVGGKIEGKGLEPFASVLAEAGGI